MEYEDGCFLACKDQGKEQPAQNYMYMCISIMRPGGAGSEVWNRVYIITPVKKFGRVRLSTIFLQNKYGEKCMQTWSDDEFLHGFEFSRVQTSRKGFQEHF